MKAESHPFQCLPLKNRYPASQRPELCVPWLYFNHYKCASFLSPRPTLLTSHKTPKGGAWLGLAGCPSEWKDLWHLYHPEVDVPPSEAHPGRKSSFHKYNKASGTSVGQSGWRVSSVTGGCLLHVFTGVVWRLHLKPGSAQALILENRTNSLTTPQNLIHLFGSKFQKLTICIAFTIWCLLDSFMKT